MKKKSRFIELIGELEQRERTRFRKFVHSPYHNPNPDLCKIIDCVDEYGRTEDLQALGKEKLHALVFPETPFDYFAMSNFLSDLQALLEQYFIWEAWKDDSIQLGGKLLEPLRRRELDSLFLSRMKAQEKRLSRQGWHNTEWFYQRFQLEEARYDFSVENEGRIGGSKLADKLHFQELYILASMLVSLCEWANYRNVASAGREAQQPDVQARLDYIRARGELIQGHTFLQLYFHILNSLLEPGEEEHYRAFRHILAKETNDFPGKILVNPYHFAINYCIKKLNKGETDYVREAFDCYREAISRKALLHGQRLMEGDLKNIVNLGIRLGEFDWTNAFLDHYSKYLPDNQRESALAFNRASLHYAREEYSEALALLRSVEFEDIYYEIGAKTMLLKIYFERMDLEPLEALLTAFRRFLYRNKLVSDYQKNIHNNLIRFTRKAIRLWGLAPSQFQSEKQRLLEEIEATREVANIDWLRNAIAARR
ncbi:MAG: hypothetical protein R3B47_06715 [Bacteroidia bacterium]